MPIAENAAFNTTLAAAATVSTEIITGKNTEMLINEIANCKNNNYSVNGIVIRPSDYWSILTIEKSTGAGYRLPQVVTFEGGQLRINGIQFMWLRKLLTDIMLVIGQELIKLSLRVFLLNFQSKRVLTLYNITARIEAQVALAVEQPLALVYGNFLAV
jgi:hypothetical protein